MQLIIKLAALMQSAQPAGNGNQWLKAGGLLPAGVASMDQPWLAAGG
jgi:hypothetical protein